MWWLLFACGAPEAPEVAALAAAGPYTVATATDTLTYAGVEGERTLALHAWFPGDRAGDLPLVVFSHGHQGFGANSSFLMAHLASHGWAVVAPDHTGNTTGDGPDRETEIYVQRPEDVAAVLDHVDAAGSLAGRVGGPVVGIGHSFGGYTILALAGATYAEAALACGEPSDFCATMTPLLADRLRAGFTEDRLSAVIAMAPGDFPLFGADGLAQATVPVMLMDASLDPGDHDAMWAALARGGNRRVAIAGGGHQMFTDFSDVLEAQDLDRDEGFEIVDVYALAWLMRAAGDEGAAGILDGEVPVSAAVRLSVP